MEFWQAEYLLYLFILPLVAGLYVFRHASRQKRLRSILGAQVDFLTSKISYTRRHVKMLLSLLVVAGLLLALARPQGKGEQADIKSLGVQIILAVDVSRSMMTEDLSPSRLAFLQQELARFISKSQGDQLALLAFAGSSTFISPFTQDHALIKNYLQDLSPEYFSSQGTSFRQVLSLAKKIFKTQSANQKNKPVQVLVLASDGGDHNTSFRQALKELVKDGVHIFTLAFGTKKGGPVPVKDYQGKLMDYKKDSKGSLVISRLESKVLKELASKGKGAYYHVTYSSQAVDQLSEDIDKLEKTLFESQTFHRKKARFQLFLLLAFALGLLELVLGERREP